ncbi:MAG: UDP-N-acetylmuramate dehydrogenase [Ilumatobacteraceae bacterium]
MSRQGAPDRAGGDIDWDLVVRQMIDAGCAVETDVALAPHTTYQVGGPARCAVRVRGIDEAVRTAEALAGVGDVPLVVVGRGSNLLVSDDGFDGLAVIVGSMNADAVSIDDETVTASGGVPLPVVARRTVAAGLCGLEWAVGVPGSVGGGVRMNAGGHGSDMAASLVDVDVLSLRSGRRVTVGAAALDLHFRGSALADHHLVLSARFAAARGDCAEALAEIVAWRRDNQPGGRNAGSVFVNPAPGTGSAGAIIDSLGLRGLRCGGAQVSEKHANFIVAEAGALAADVVEVMTIVHDKVRDATGTVLRSEVRLVGFDARTVSRFADVAHSGADHDAARSALAAIMGEL